MKKLGGAIIGCGAIAREHLAAVAELDNVEIIAVCDLSPARAEATAEQFGIANWYTNYEELLANARPDLVHVTTSPAAHFPIAKTCLSAGLNVLCEKPITTDYSSFLTLRQIAAMNDCLLMENQNFRFHSSVRRISDLLDKGRLGNIVDVKISICLNLFDRDSPYVDTNTPHPTWVLPGGVIGDFLPHIAYLTYLFAGPISSLRTIWGKHRSESPLPADEFRCIMKGERTTAYVSFSGNCQPDGFWLTVCGTKGQAEANLFEPPRLTLRSLRSGEPALMRMVDGASEARAVLTGSIGGFWRKLAGTSSYDGLGKSVARTYAAIATRSPPPVSLDEIDAAARLVDRFAAEEFKL